MVKMRQLTSSETELARTVYVSLAADRDLGGPNSLTRQRLAMPVAKLVRAT